jgi:deazaflavin-dependent oxidoreductase (nitroreductase family)
MPLVSSRLGGWFYVRVAPAIDRVLLRISGGRISTAVGYPALILNTVGAKSGLPRSTPLIYLPLEQQLIVIASNGGHPNHPGWYYNLRANPDVTLQIGEQVLPYHAHEASGTERAELWQRAAALYPGYLNYQQRASNREIPVIVLRARINQPG